MTAALLHALTISLCPCAGLALASVGAGAPEGAVSASYSFPAGHFGEQAWSPKPGQTAEVSRVQ